MIKDFSYLKDFVLVNVSSPKHYLLVVLGSFLDKNDGWKTKVFAYSGPSSDKVYNLALKDLKKNKITNVAPFPIIEKEFKEFMKFVK